MFLCVGKRWLTQAMSNVLQLFSHSIPFAAGPLAEQFKNSMGGAQAAEKRHDWNNFNMSFKLIFVTHHHHCCPDLLYQKDIFMPELMELGKLIFLRYWLWQLYIHTAWKRALRIKYTARDLVKRTVCKTNILWFKWVILHLNDAGDSAAPLFFCLLFTFYSWDTSSIL